MTSDRVGHVSGQHARLPGVFIGEIRPSCGAGAGGCVKVLPELVPNDRHDLFVRDLTPPPFRGSQSRDGTGDKFASTVSVGFSVHRDRPGVIDGGWGRT